MRHIQHQFSADDGGGLKGKSVEREEVAALGDRARGGIPDEVVLEAGSIDVADAIQVPPVRLGQSPMAAISVSRLHPGE